MKTHTYEVLFQSGHGDEKVVLERRDDGRIVLTTGAETRELVTPMQYIGSKITTEKWLEELTESFEGDRAAAEIFVQAAGRELPEKATDEAV